MVHARRPADGETSGIGKFASVSDECGKWIWRSVEFDPVRECMRLLCPAIFLWMLGHGCVRPLQASLDGRSKVVAGSKPHDLSTGSDHKTPTLGSGQIGREDNLLRTSAEYPVLFHFSI